MHENREEKDDRQRNADKPEQHASSKTHVSLLYDGVLRPYAKKVPAWELWNAKILKPTIGDVPLRAFQARDSILFRRFSSLGRLSDSGGSVIGVAMRSPNFPESAIASMCRELTATGERPGG